jgi:hypothetical protein
VEIPVFVRNSGPGTFTSSLNVIGEGATAAITLKAQITEAPQKPVIPHTSAAPDLRMTPVQNETRPVSAENVPQKIMLPPIPMNAREIPNALGKFARNVGPDSATLDWPVRLGAGNNARVEERVLSRSEDGRLKIGWSPLDEVSITPVPGRVIAELRGLQPGTYYTVRVAIGKDADASVLFTSDFRTVAKKPLFTSAWRTPMLVVTLAVLVFAVWRSRRSSQRMGL